MVDWPPRAEGASLGPVRVDARGALGAARSGSDGRAPSLEQDDVAPAAIGIAADPFLDADPAEPDPLVEREARGVLRLDAGDQRPDTGGLRRRDQGPEQRAADAPPARGRVDIDALPHDPGIDVTRRVAGERRPAHDIAIEPRDKP